MISVAEQYLAAHFAQIARQHGFHRSLRPHRHERRRFNHTMGRNETAESRAGARVSLYDRKITSHNSILVRGAAFGFSIIDQKTLGTGKSFAGLVL
jgi:hypothetical protein